MVTIEESDDERSIVTPGLRLRFNWTGDRWTHAIDLGPGPEPDERWPWSIDPRRGQWLVLAEAVEWDSPSTDPSNVLNPVFQELHFQDDARGATALLVGQAGPHHFSASFRVEDDMQAKASRIDIRDGLDGYRPRVSVDIADRCSSPITSLCSSYRIHDPIQSYLLADEPDEAGRFARPFVLWESGLWRLGRGDLAFGSPDRDRSPCRLVMVGEGPGVSDGPWHASFFSGVDPRSRTQRYTYCWSHDCTTSRFLEVLRERDPEYDAQMRQVEADRERHRAENLKRLEDPEVQSWLKRWGQDPETWRDLY